MFVVTVLFEIKSGFVEDFRPVMLRQAENSLHKEPGCLQFDVSVDPALPGSFFLYEVYTDEAAFQAHLETEHFNTFDATVAGWVETKTIRVFKRLSS